VTSDVAAEAGDLAGAARDDHAVSDDRTARILDVEIAAARALPAHLAGARVQSDDVIVPGGEDDHVAIERDGALALAVGSGNMSFGGKGWRYSQMSSPLVASIAWITSPGCPDT
jgi:hypothetical protein